MKRPPFRPADGFLLDTPRPRLTDKSPWLLALEERQRNQAWQTQNVIRLRDRRSADGK